MVGCSSDDDNKNLNSNASYPECFQVQIDSMILLLQSRNPRSNIKKYRYQNQDVYVAYINAIDDEQNFVVNQKCDTICILGGLYPPDQCEDWDNAKYLETVWIDER